MKESTKRLHLSTFIITALFIIYFALIIVVNFQSPPSYYNSDMYSDIILAQKMWTDKALFPDTWNFGNQLYVVATPVLSALMCGIFNNPYIAMGAASTVMSILIFITFLWMMKAAVPNLETRLYGLVYFIGIMLFFGDAAVKFRGWQLLFTMCSYYACYAITAFLAFGCYLRCHQKWNIRLFILLLAACLLSFATGIQSLRQTIVMTIPLILVEILHIVANIFQKRKCFTKSTYVASALSIFNIAGIVASKLISVRQYRILGEISLLHPRDYLAAFSESISNILGLFLNYSAKGLLLSGAYLVLNIAVFFLLILRYFRTNRQTAVTLLMLFAASLGCIWGIDIISSMYIREIYYFMLYPLLAILIMLVYSELSGHLKKILLIVPLCLFLISIPRHIISLTDDIVHRNKDISYEISDYLTENDYTVLFGLWDFGDEIAVASNGNLKMQFWSDGSTFETYAPLRESEIYDADVNQIIYIFHSTYSLEQGMKKAAEMNTDLTIRKEYNTDEKTYYLCTASKNLMKMYTKVH